MKNTPAYQALTNLSADTLIRVYRNGGNKQCASLEFLIMKPGITTESRHEDNILAVVAVDTKVGMNSWVTYSEDPAFGGDGTVELLTDEADEQYVLLRNGDFSQPFDMTCDEVAAQMLVYGQE